MQEDPQPLDEADLESVVEDREIAPRLARSQIVSVRLSVRELRLLAREARRNAMTVGAYVKRAAIEAAEFGRLSPEVPVQFAVSVEGVAYQGLEPDLVSVAGSCGEVTSINPDQAWVSISS